MNYLVSIIIPVYKTEKYIEACLQSALAQTIAGYDRAQTIEVIVVDDGSPDQSIERIQSYLSSHPNVRLLQQENAGQSAARNHAITVAQGEYLYFLDSDDLLPHNAIEALYQLAKQTDSEVIIAQSKAFNQNRSWFIEDHAEVASSAFRQVNFIDQPILVKTTPPWAKLYKSELIRQHAIHFPEGIGLAEDWIFVLHALSQANHISTTPDITYLYRGRNDVGNLSCTQQVNQKVFYDLMQVYQLTKKFSLPAAHQRLAKQFIIKSLLYRLLKLAKSYSLDTALPTYQVLAAFLKIETKPEDWAALPEHAKLVLDLLHHDLYLAAHHAAQHRYKMAWLTDAGNVLPATLFSRYQTTYKRTCFLPLKRIKKRVQSSLTLSAWRLKYQFAKILADLYPRNGKIVLIGERLGKTANDTSYHFFKHCQEDGSAQAQYFYTIQKHAPTREKIHSCRNIVDYGSLKHFFLFHRASAYVFSDNMRDIFRQWKRVHAEHAHKKKIFLQHGIFALNRAKGYYDRHSMEQRGERPDCFIVSSELEKTLVCNQFDFQEEEVVVTGLSRFDNLPTTRSQPSGTILMLFTWREWLEKMSPDAFEQSDYCQKIVELIHHPILRQMHAQHGLKITLCLHHKMAQYIQHLPIIENVRIVSMSDTDIQPHIIQADLMITDYSSAAFDMLYQNKPVIFYWFDHQAFFAKRGGPLIRSTQDMHDAIAYHCENALNLVQQAIQRQFNITQIQRAWAKEFFSHKDQNHSQRIKNKLQQLL